MTEAEIVAALERVFVDVLMVPAPGIDEELLRSGRLDSMAVIALIVEIEDRFGVRIDTDDLALDSFATVRDIVATVQRATRDEPGVGGSPTTSGA